MLWSFNRVPTMSNADFETYDLGDWPLQSGSSLPKAYIAYKTFGDVKNPAIVYPTWFSGSIADNVWLVGQGMALDPAHYFIIIPGLFGNGQSMSPSNTRDLHPFPKISFHDNVRAQHRLVTEHFKIKHLYCVIGWSMGAGQTYQWITRYPDFMDVAVPFCGSARTSLHNQVFLEGTKSALLAAKGVEGGGVASKGDDRRGFWTEKERKVGLKAFGRVYAGWGFSQTFYREKLHESHFGFEDLESFLVGFWEGWACSKDPENLLVMLQTWQTADCSQQEPYNGDFEAAMRAIKAKTLTLPSKTDLYFPPEDSEYEVANMSSGVGELAIFPSIWGHWAGGPGDSKDDVKWLDEKLKSHFAANKAGGR